MSSVLLQFHPATRALGEGDDAIEGRRVSIFPVLDTGC